MSARSRRVRRCVSLYIEKRERLTFDPVRLLEGDDGLLVQCENVALVPHRDRGIVLTPDELLALDAVSQSVWKTADEVAVAIGDATMRGLIAKGILVQEGTRAGIRDQQIRDAHWHPLMAVAHAQGRWSRTDSAAAQREARQQSVVDMVAACGPPPAHFHTRTDARSRSPLPRPSRGDLDTLMARRATCRNFDTRRSLAPADLSVMLHRSFGVHASEELAPGAVALKKNHPSGGALHPLEAYLIVQRVDGLQPGLYHYHAETHALDLLREMSADAAHAFSLLAVAAQDYFADAPVMLVIAARFARSFWKYRGHPKIYRAILLEIGHVSQNLYLAATEHGLGAYVTAAINEVEIEQAFALDPLLEGPLAICGFGTRSAHRRTVELDPGARVWDRAGRLLDGTIAVG